MEWEWIVLRTKTFREKLAEEYLAKKSIACYLPLRQVLPKPGSRIRKPVDTPLFPGYIFARPEGTRLFEMRYVPGTCGLIQFNGKPAAVPGEEIERIRLISKSGHGLETHPLLHPGERVRIVKGPLAGLEGELVRFKNGLRLVVNVVLLNQSVSVELESDRLEPA